MLENLLFSLNSTLPLFFIMLLGYVLHRTGFLSDAFVAGANKFVFYAALPVQLFRDLGKTTSAPPLTAGMSCSALWSHW